MRASRIKHFFRLALKWLGGMPEQMSASINNVWIRTDRVIAERRNCGILLNTIMAIYKKWHRKPWSTMLRYVKKNLRGHLLTFWVVQVQQLVRLCVCVCVCPDNNICIHRMKWRHSNLWLRYDLHVEGHDVELCEVNWRRFATLFKQGVALTKRNTTGPPWSVGRPTAARTRRPARPPAGSVTDDDRRRWHTLASKTTLAH